MSKTITVIQGDWEYTPVEKPDEGKWYWAKIDSKWTAVLHVEFVYSGLWVRLDLSDGEISYMKVPALYARKPAKREPKRLWATDDLEYISDGCPHNDDIREQCRQYVEVIPPVVKELPDSEGDWSERGETRVRNVFFIKGDNRPCFSSSEMFGYSRCEKGEWIKLDDRIQQAWKDADEKG